MTCRLADVMPMALGAALVALPAAGCLDHSTTVPPDSLSNVLAPGAAVLVGAGDIAECNSLGDEATADLLDSIPGEVFAAGDNAYPDGSSADYANCFAPSWGRHKERIHPAPGNHEYNTPGAADYFAYFGAAAGDPDRGYYSYEVGAWHVIALNSNVDASATSPQAQWLRADLAASRAPCTLAYWHHPRFSSGAYHGNSDRMRPLWQALYEAGADIVVSGHEHQYERFAPQTADGVADPAHGIREFVAGTGGASPGYPFSNPPIANSEVRNNTTSGVLRFVLDSTGYAWQFIPQAGRTFRDSGSGTCHDAPANQPPVASAGGPYLTSTGTIHAHGDGSVDPDGNVPLSFHWDFGDGNTNDGPHPSHTYLASGTYTVTLLATDTRGAHSPPAFAKATVSIPSGAPVVVSAAGNIAACGTTNAETTAQILDTLPGFVFTLGDNAFPSASPTAYQTCYHPTWGRHKTRTYATLGNHEYDDGRAEGAFGYFGDRAGAPNGYYSLDFGAWHVVVLNDNDAFVPFATGSAQERWLQADLAAHPAACLLAVWHVPLFLSSNEAGYTENSSRRDLWNALYAAGADVVLNGQQHHYERFTPMDPQGGLDPVFGIREFNVGTGGESLALPTVATHPNSEVRSATFGVLKLTLRGSGYDWQFMPQSGKSFSDSGSGVCHPAPAATPPTTPPGPAVRIPRRDQ